MIQLAGRKALERFAAKDKYVFHGSQNGSLIQLRPVAGGSKRYNTETGEVSLAKKYVYATSHLDSAIFIATVWRRIGASGWTISGITSDKAKYEFHASPEATAEAGKPSNEGFVYVLNKTDFTQDSENPYELVSPKAVRPYAIVSVTAKELKPDFRTLSSPPHYD